MKEPWFTIFETIKETGLFFLLHYFTGRPPEAGKKPTASDVAGAAGHYFSVRAKKTKDDEISYNGLLADLDDAEIDNLNELFEYEPMKPHVEDFQWLIAKIAEGDKKGAIKRLKRIARQPSAEMRFEEVKLNRMIEPDPADMTEELKSRIGEVTAKINDYLKTFGKKARELNEEAAADFESSGLLGWARGLEQRARALRDREREKFMARQNNENQQGGN